MASSCGRLRGLDRKATKPTFSSLTQGRKLTSTQNEFLDLAINHLTERGVINPAVFHESPYTDVSDKGISGVFLEADVQAIIGVINDLSLKAVA